MDRVNFVMWTSTVRTHPLLLPD